MPTKKKPEKEPKGSKKGSKSNDKDKDKDSNEKASGDLDPAEQIRQEGIVATYALNAKALHRNFRDISVSNLTVTFHGSPLIEEAELSLNYGNRYGYLGRNGCGKTTFMKVIGARAIPIAEGIDIYHHKEEIEASDMTAKEAVMSVDVERQKLEAEADMLNDLMTSDDAGGNDDIMDRLNQIYERLEQMDASTAETRASKILSGLGFTPEKQSKKTKEFSGGWRMRIALARALFIQPTLLLLDEPTNHLDMEAVVWLEDYLAKWTKILLIVSHSQDFLNNVCTHIVHHTKQRQLVYYSGNYDTFIKTRAEKEEEQEKRFKSEQDQIKHMKEYVARFGQGNAKMARQAQSKEKILDKMLKSGLTDKVESEKPLDFKFPDPGKLAPPVLQCNDISFGYPGCPILYSNVDFGVDLDSRVALVGPNGAGKSTLLKIMTGELMPIEGAVRPHVHLRISKFSQHFVDVLDLEMNPLDYFLKTFTDMTREDGRKFLGRFGVSGSVQTQIMGHLSDGQKSRVVFAKMAKESPHMLFLDEPTNHLDMESIDSLAKAINNFTGGMVLVSHDMRLISQVAKEIWYCDNRTLYKFIGEINDFKLHLKRQMVKDNLIDGDSAKAAVVSKEKEKSMFVPLNPLKPPGPPAIAPLLAPPAKKDDEDPVLKARKELEALKLASKAKATEEKKQAMESALATLKKEKEASDNIDGDNVDDEDDEKSKVEEKALQKARRKAEKEAKEKFDKEQEEERERRRLEKIKDNEDAKKAKEVADKEREEWLAEKAVRDAKKKAEEDAELARVQALIEQRKAEKAARKAAREEARRVEQEAARKEVEERVLADPWTQQQQLAFEKALMEYTPDMQKLERWTKISFLVGKSKNQCMARYKYLKEYVVKQKKIAAKE